MKKFLITLTLFAVIAFVILFIYNSKQHNNKTTANQESNNLIMNNNMETTMKKITPNIMVDDVNATVDYYKNNLDFQIVMGVDEKKEVKMGDSAAETHLTWAMIKKNDVDIMIQRKDSMIEELPEFEGLKIGGTFTLYINMLDTKGFYDKIKNKVEIIKDIHKTFYGADEFVIKDLNGYIIYFAEAQNG